MALLDLDAELEAGLEAPKNEAVGAARPQTRKSLENALAGGAKGEVPPKLVSLLKRAMRTVDTKGPVEGARLALKALDMAPDFALANHTMGLCLERMGRLSKALEFYERALKLDPKNPEIYQNLGMIAWQLDMLEGAEKFLRLFLQMAPNNPSGQINLSGILRDQGRFPDAIELLRQAIYRDETNPDLWNSLGTVLLEAGDVAQAETFYREALRLDPGFSRGHHNLAYTRELQGDVEAAIEHFKRALEAPKSDQDKRTMRHALSLSTLASGDLKTGWELYAARLDPKFSIATLFQIDAPMWDGADPGALAGKTVLICGEQGLGDEVMFAQMIPDIIEAVGPGGEVRLAVEPRLVALMQRSFPSVKVARHYTISREGRELRLLVHRFLLLRHRNRLPGEGGFVDLQRIDLYYAQVGRDHVALAQAHHIAGYEFIRFHFLFFSAADGRRFHLAHLLERLHRPDGTPLRKEADERVDQDHAGDGDRLHRLPEEQRYDHGHYEQQHDQALELIPQNRPDAASLDPSEGIGAEPLAPLSDLVGTQPLLRSPERVEHLFRRLRPRLLREGDRCLIRMLWHPRTAGLSLLTG